MRKIIILVVLVFLIFCCYEVVVTGVAFNENISISNYEEVEDSSRSLDTLISQLVNVNEIEFPSKKSDLSSTIKLYKQKKEEYEELQALLEQNSSEAEISLVDIYDIDFLWTTIGNYGTEEGISLKFDVVKSITSTISSKEYTMCDLKFTVSGDYIPITDFIYDLEEDSKLGFEISSFTLAKGGDNLQATFTVEEVPINNENLTELTTSTDLGTVHQNFNNNSNNNNNTTTSGTNTTNSTNTVGSNTGV